MNSTGAATGKPGAGVIGTGAASLQRDVIAATTNDPLAEASASQPRNNASMYQPYVPGGSVSEAVVAVVVPRPDAELAGAEIQAHVAAALSAYKVPSRVHVRTGMLPRNPVGKLLKGTLKSEYAST